MIRFVHALLMVHERYVLQLRDDKPDIPAPGVWSLFGGHVEKGETPREALIREVEEELCLKLTDCRLFWTVERYSPYVNSPASYSFFEANITHLWEQHRLMEGQAARHFAFHELHGLKISPFIRETLERHHGKLSGNDSAMLALD